MPRKSNTRRAQGEGTIRQRPDGRWEARYTVGRDGSGKQVRRSIYGDTEKEVLKRLQQAQVDIENGTYSEPSKLTISEWLDIWLRDYTVNIKPSTLSTYTHNINKHIKPALGAVKLQKLNAHTVQGFYKGLTSSGRILQKGQKKRSPARTVCKNDKEHTCNAPRSVKASGITFVYQN